MTRPGLFRQCDVTDNAYVVEDLHQMDQPLRRAVKFKIIFLLICVYILIKANTQHNSVAT